VGVAVYFSAFLIFFTVTRMNYCSRI